MNQVFQTTKTLRFREADPAGIMFFGNIFGFAHDAFEEFIQAAGYAYKEWFGQSEVMIPIRHTSGDFTAPFRPGETYSVLVSVASFGETSFTMHYRFQQGSTAHAEVKMVHAVVDRQTRRKTALPALIQERLAPYLESPTQT